jgi:hypothetical protein
VRGSEIRVRFSQGYETKQMWNLVIRKSRKRMRAFSALRDLDGILAIKGQR